MFELTISTCKAKAKDITFILSRLRPKFKSMKGIIVCEEFDGRVYLALAVNEDKKDYALSLIFDAVAEAIIRDYKEEYLLENLKIKLNSNMVLKAFARALTMFDKASDKEIIKKYLKPSGEILIDSLFHFRLWELEKRWQDIVLLVIENSSYLLANGTLMELMRFLIMTSETETGEVHMHERAGVVYAESVEGTEIFKLNYKGKDDNVKISVANELISLAPEKIILHSDIIDKDLTSFIASLFDGKVSIIK